MSATKILINGNIHTVDACFRTVPAMAIEGDKILYAGDNDKAMAFAGEGTVIEDLQGKTVTPGFIDNHVHARMTGYNYSRMSCLNLTKEQILEGIGKLAKEAEPGEWIITGTGWDSGSPRFVLMISSLRTSAPKAVFPHELSNQPPRFTPNTLVL